LQPYFKVVGAQRGKPRKKRLGFMAVLAQLEEDDRAARREAGRRR
jgi:hypothetical protein